jgi:hypothetical protein
MIPQFTESETDTAAAWNQLDAEFRNLDKGSVGENFDPEERTSDGPLVGPRNPPHAPWKRRIVQWIVRNRKMMRLFLLGMLCGVIITAAFTYVFAIPANSTYWQTEIWKRGGAAWTADKNGRIGWRWMVEPIPDNPRPVKRAVVPSSQTDVRIEQL